MSCLPGGGYVGIITVGGPVCASEAEALAAVRHLAAASLTVPHRAREAEDADMGPPSAKKRKRDALPAIDFKDSSALLQEYALRHGKDVAFVGDKDGACHVTRVVVGGVEHVGRAKPSKASAKNDAADAFFRAVVDLEPHTTDPLVASWRERFSQDPADALGRVGLLDQFPWRREGVADREKFSAMRDFLRRSREAAMETARPNADLGLSPDECVWLLKTHASGKFASVLPRVVRIAVAKGSQTAPDGTAWADGAVDGKKNTTQAHEFGIFAVLDDGTAADLSWRKLKWREA